MTHSLTVRKGSQLWAAAGGPLGLWSQVRTHSGQLSWVLAGKFGLLGANAAVMLFLANHLELKAYGLLVITISCQLLLSRVLMVGVDAGMVRLTALPELSLRSQEVVTAGLILMACTSGLMLLVWLLIAPALASFAVPNWLVACIAAGAIGTSLVDYGYNYRLARHEYSLAALAQGGTAIWRVGLTIFAAVMLPAYPIAVFAAYHGASLLSGVFQTVIVAARRRRPSRELIKRLLGYSFWLGNANVIVIFSLYQGTLLLTLLKQPEATGLFGLGLTLSLGFFAIYNAYSEYLSVRIRSVAHVEEIGRFIKRAMAGALLLALACVPLVLAVTVLMHSMLAPRWLEVLPIFLYLSASMVLLIFQAPLVATCHYLLKPQLITLGWVVRVVLIGVAGFMLAQVMGATGAAIGQLVGSTLALLVLSGLVARSWRSLLRPPITSNSSQEL